MVCTRSDIGFVIRMLKRDQRNTGSDYWRTTKEVQVPRISFLRIDKTQLGGC